jgi:hypothetical protein
VRFFDFHRRWIDDFPDAMFYDIQHLDVASEAFT